MENYTNTTFLGGTPKNTLFCVILDGFEEGQAKSLKAVSKMVEKNGAKVFKTIEEIAIFLNLAYQ